MTTTTIKVDCETRDRLKAQASAAGLTLGQHVARLADAADRDARLSALRDAVAATPQRDLADWAAEADLWEAAEWEAAGSERRRATRAG